MARRPIDKIRESAGMLEIVDPEDPSGISEMLNISDDRLFVIKDRSVYEILLADNIDPDRTNPHIPNSYRKALNCGLSDEDFSRILMMVNHLCDESRLENHIERGFILTSTFRLQERICRIREFIEIIEREQNSCIKSIESAEVEKNKGYRLPQIQNLEPDRKVVERYQHFVIHRLCSEDGGSDALERYRSC
jgi:hypothetical protein